MMPDPQRVQEILDRTLVKGASGGGEVQIVLAGTGVIKKINIDETMLQQMLKTVLESMIIAAYADAHARLQEELIRCLGQLTLGENR